MSDYAFTNRDRVGPFRSTKSPRPFQLPLLKKWCFGRNLVDDHPVGSPPLMFQLASFWLLVLDTTLKTQLITWCVIQEKVKQPCRVPVPYVCYGQHSLDELECTKSWRWPFPVPWWGRTCRVVLWFVSPSIRSVP